MENQKTIGAIIDDIAQAIANLNEGMVDPAQKFCSDIKRIVVDLEELPKSEQLMAISVMEASMDAAGEKLSEVFEKALADKAPA